MQAGALHIAAKACCFVSSHPLYIAVSQPRVLDLISPAKTLSNMSFQADPSPANILDLPSTWLARFVQHVASGAGGLANAAALSQTCKSFNALSDSSAVIYLNIRLDNPLHSLGHPFLRWLAKRQGRVAGLTAELQLSAMIGPEPGAEHLRMMFGIPGLHLTLRCMDLIRSPDDSIMTEVLRPYGHLVDHLISVVCIDGEGLRLQDFCVTAAPCRSLGLTVEDSSEEPCNIGALDLVANSLVQLRLMNRRGVSDKFENVGSLSSLSQLTLLSLNAFNFRAEDPWIHLVGLTNLKQLSLGYAAVGDPSALSALIGLTSLSLHSYRPHAMHGGLPSSCTFSSLQPLSALQALEELVLEGNACSARSLHGLAELGKLKLLELTARVLKSLAGMSTGLTSLVLTGATRLDSLAGIEQSQGLQNLKVGCYALTSLQPLASLDSLRDLRIGGIFTCLAGLEGKLCTSLHSLSLECCSELRQLSGIEGLTALQQLSVYMCGVTSLEPVAQLVGGLKELMVHYCRKVQEEVLELPNLQPTADVRIGGSNVKEVVLAGGVRRRQYH